MKFFLPVIVAAVQHNPRVEPCPLFFSALTSPVVTSAKLSISVLSNTSLYISACDGVCNLWNVCTVSDSPNFAQGQRWRLILKGKSLVTCVQHENASRQNDLPPSASKSHQGILLLHSNYAQQICNTREWLGMETLLSLCTKSHLKKLFMVQWCANNSLSKQSGTV